MYSKKVNVFLSEKSTVGLFLKDILGYTGNPALVEVIAYFTFLVLALWGYFRPTTAKSRIEGETDTKVTGATAGQ